MEMFGRAGQLTASDQHRLEELERTVVQGRLCSLLFPVFLQSYTCHTGKSHPAVVYAVAGRIEKLNKMGLHCSPGVVAHLIREFARDATR